MKRKTVGYIVEASKGGMMGFGYPPNGTLYFGCAPALFMNRNAGYNAIKRTIRSRPTFVKEFGQMHLRRIEEAP